MVESCVKGDCCEQGFPRVLGSADEERARLEAARELIKNHNPTRGSVAETALRTLLREFLPHRCGIGTGFMLAPDGTASPQLDLIIFDQLESTPLYRDGDLVVVSPGTVYLVIEVKSDLNSAALTEAFENVGSVKALNQSTRCLVFGYASATADTLKEHLPAEQAKYSPRVPEQILCLDRKLFIAWNPASMRYEGFQLDAGPTQQLINEVLSAGNVTNLQPYLPGLTPTTKLFAV